MLTSLFLIPVFDILTIFTVNKYYVITVTVKALKKRNTCLGNILHTCTYHTNDAFTLLYSLLYSLLFGNAYSHFVLQGSDSITGAERTKLFIGLSGAALVGSLLLLTLRKKRDTDAGNLVNLNSRYFILIFFQHVNFYRNDFPESFFLNM